MSATPATPGTRRSEPQSLSPLIEARYHAAPQRALFAFRVQALVLQAQGPQAARLVCFPDNGPVAALEPAGLQPAAVPASAPPFHDTAPCEVR